MARPKREKIAPADEARALGEAALALLEQKGVAAVTLRSVAKKAGVSFAAAHRQFGTLDAMLVELVNAGLAELRRQVTDAAVAPGQKAERIARIGAAYVRFATQYPALLRLMMARPSKRPEWNGIDGAAGKIGEDIGAALGDPALGLAVWGAAHGLAVLTLDNIMDLGQRAAGTQVLPSRTEILLRSMFAQRE